MALSANTAPQWALPPAGNSVISLPVYGSVHIYRGALVGLSPNGYAKPFECGDVFVGIALEEFNNTSSIAGVVSALGDDGERGKDTVKVAHANCHFVGAISGVAYDDIGKAVYATADDALGFFGGAYSFVGRVVNYQSSGHAIIKLKEPGELPKDSDLGCLYQFENAAHPWTATGVVAGTAYLPSGFAVTSALGLGMTHNSGAAPQIEGEFDATAEIAYATLYGLQSVLVSTGGARFRARLVMSDKADAAAVDFDWGVGTILTANSIASLSHGDLTDKAAFHMDGGSDNILVWSEATNTETALSDSTIDNDSTTDTYKDFLVIVRKDGTAEFWIDSGSGFVRVLATTAYAVASSANVAPLINMEKTSDDTTAVWLCREVEFTGARTVAIG